MHLEGREKHTAQHMPFKAHVADLRRRAERDLAAFGRQSGCRAGEGDRSDHCERRRRRHEDQCAEYSQRRRHAY